MTLSSSFLLNNGYVFKPWLLSATAAIFGEATTLGNGNTFSNANTDTAYRVPDRPFTLTSNICLANQREVDPIKFNDEIK